MYGAFYRIQPKAGQHQAVLDSLFRWEQEYLPQVSGYVSGYVLEPAVQAQKLPVGILVFVVFDSQAAYTRHREDPQQDRWEQHLRILLAQDPEWHEGEITELFAQPRGL